MLKTKLCKVCGEPIKINWPSTALHKKCSAHKEKKYQRKYYFSVTKKKRKLNKLKKNIFNGLSTEKSTTDDIKINAVK